MQPGKGYPNSMKPGTFQNGFVQDFIIRVCQIFFNQSPVVPDQLLQQGDDGDEKCTFRVRSKNFRQSLPKKWNQRPVVKR